MNDNYTENSLNSEDYSVWAELARWFLLVLFFSASLFALSSLIFLTVNNEWFIARYYSDSVLNYFLATFPFPYLLITLCLLFITYFIFIYTQIGKRLTFYKSFLYIVFSLVIFSSLIYYSGLASRFNSFSSNFVCYEYINGNHSKVWQRPELGLLSGQIATINDLDNFLLVDYTGKTWFVQADHTKIADKSLIETGQMIKLIGRKNNAQGFEAQQIFTLK